MPPPPAAMRPIAQRADQRIDERLDHQRRHDGEADRSGGQPDDLIIIEQQEGGEAAIFDAKGKAAEPEGESAAEGQLARRRNRKGLAHAANAASASNKPGVSGSQLCRIPTASPPSTRMCVPVTNAASSLSR